MIDPKASLTFLPVQLSRNRITHTIDALDPVTFPDRSPLRYLLTLKVPEYAQASTFMALPTLEGREKPPVTQDGATTYEGTFFQFDSILDGFMALQKPSYRQSELSSIATLTMPYKLTEQVLPGGAEVERGIKWLLKGGITEADAVGWADRFASDYQADARQFLTWQPDGKIVGREQEEYLYFLLNCSPLPTEVRLRVEYTLQNGTIDEMTLLTLKNVVQYQVICAPVGPSMLAAQVPAGTALARYRIWLSNQANERLSQVRSFTVDRRYRRNERQILFSNSLGGFDTLRLVGSGSETLKVQRSSAERERPLGAVGFSELYITDVVGERTLTVSTGYFERHAVKTLRYLDELLLAREWYLITDKGHIPLELLTTDVVDHEDDGDLVARQFSFRQVDVQLSYSDLPAAPAQAARPAGWRGVGMMHLLDAMGKRTGLGRPIRLQKYYLDDGSIYKPLTQKPNAPGDPDYSGGLPLAGIEPGTTPFPSAEIARTTTYSRANCPAGQVGGPATIVITAGKYGGEADGDADQLAEAEYASLNTQAYANQYGTCTVSPEIYAWSVPAGKWHYRAGQPSKMSVHHTTSLVPDMGNAYGLATGPNVYAPGSNDLDFPVINDNFWFLYTMGTPGQLYRIRVFRNGLPIKDTTFTMNQDGFELHLLHPMSETLNSEDKLYLDLTTA
ncbi:DUF5977 domain-containing protein [Larkinella sp. GY13]|uniref:DUF5977 domain-containing protein n=1 Tax=Larkinella sp. GY13 TaxID=3453720 RepID=UPI003EEFB8FF